MPPNTSASRVVVFSGAFFVTFVGGFACIDYNRTMDKEYKPQYDRRKSNHLGEALDQLHTKAFSDRLRYEHFVTNGHRCMNLTFSICRQRRNSLN